MMQHNLFRSKAGNKTYISLTYSVNKHNNKMDIKPCMENFDGIFFPEDKNILVYDV